MTRINILGGTGYGGAELAAEASRRGHQVTSFSRNAPAEPLPGVRYLTGSILDPDFQAQVADSADVVFSALSPRGELAGRLEGVVQQLITRLRGTGIRFGFLGGASSLRVAADGPLLFDTNPVDPAVLPEVRTGMAVLDLLRAAPDDLDWFYVSPAAEFGAWAPGERTGTYRIGGDVLLVDEEGRSRISSADLALAVVDEIESGAHRRQRFAVAY